MTNFIQKGETMTLTAPYAVSSGGGALVGKIFGVACKTLANAVKGEFMTEGVFDLAKDTSTFATGDPVYWDNTNKVATSTFQSNALIGVADVTVYESTAALGGSSGDATVRVKLLGSPVTAVFKSAETTATGSAQNVAHGLPGTPSEVCVYPTETSAATVGVYDLSEGTHTSTNVVVTVTADKKFKVIARY